MTIKLIKRGQESNIKEQPAQPKEIDLVLTMQSWVEEFKSRKSKPDLSVLGAVRQN